MYMYYLWFYSFNLNFHEYFSSYYASREICEINQVIVLDKQVP